jgi:signal transduction histidine kinase
VVTDDGSGPGNAASSGNGLLGISERVRVYGGDLSTGQAAGGGFRVRARLPVEGGAG